MKKKNKKRDSAPSAIDSPVFKGKKCRRCGNLKSVEDFGKCTSNKDGLHSYCKKCLSEYDKERARKKRTSAKTGIKHKEKTSPEKLKVVQGQQQSPFVIVVDLSEYPDVYEGIKEIAREEERTIEGQVRYWLKNEEFLQANFDLDQHPSGKVVSVPE